MYCPGIYKDWKGVGILLYINNILEIREGTTDEIEWNWNHSRGKMVKEILLGLYCEFGDYLHCVVGTERNAERIA